MNTLDIHVLLHVANYMGMCDIAQLRATCESNRLLFSSSNVIGQALVNQYGVEGGSQIAFANCHEKVVMWICQNFTDQLNWWWISTREELSEAFIRKFHDKVNWVQISQHQNLSEDFIREFKDKVDWWDISESQELSEAFIKEFQNKVRWAHIPRNEVFSEAFREEFGNRLY